MLTLHYSSQPALPAQTRVLVVEDAPVVRTMIEQLLRTMGYRVQCADNGLEALSVLETSSTGFDAILLDNIMPEMDGLSLLARLKVDARFWMIPVIMLTDNDDADMVQTCIDAGAFYHLTKPVTPGMLASVTQAAVSHRKRAESFAMDVRRQRGGMALMQRASWTFASVDEAEDLAVFIASGLPEAEKRVNCLAELLVNAVEHGLLGVGYQDKTTLVRENRWRAELDRRAALNEASRRCCTATYERLNSQTATLFIQDPGHGFAWQTYLTLNAERASDNHGRGIARARMISFPDLTYHGNGNALTVNLALQ